MEDFPILLLFLIFYLVSASSGKKKKRKKAPVSAFGRKATQDPRKALQEMLAKAERMPDRREEKEPAGYVLCDPQQMHLHEVSQKQFADTSEGEDPCHAGGHAVLEETPLDTQPIQMDDGFAQDVLRGVIMSEILTRPCERRAMQRKGFRNHG